MQVRQKTSLAEELSDRYGPRFGQIAVEMGFITRAQLIDALSLQIDDELAGRGHRLLGAILFERDLMSAAQIEEVLNALFKGMRAETTTKP